MKIPKKLNKPSYDRYSMIKNKCVVTVLILFCLACKDTGDTKQLVDEIAEVVTFDSVQWRTQDGHTYPYREAMLDDLVYNSDYRKLKKDEVLKWLGEPTRVDGNFLFYRIKDRRIGLWTLHAKTLVIKFYENDYIEWMKIHE